MNHGYSVAAPGIVSACMSHAAKNVTAPAISMPTTEIELELSIDS